MEQYRRNESRFRMLEGLGPERSRMLQAAASLEAERRLALYRHLSEWQAPGVMPSAPPKDEP